jgi:alpha-tubulin suppressor-like RCC1 family protein
MATTVVSGVQYSGIWNISSQANAKAAGTWPRPLPGGPGELYAWGSNTNGQLGLGNQTYYSSPKQVGALATWSLVAVGGNGSQNYFSISTTSNGTLFAWGNNQYGQLGLGNTTYYSSPKQIGALANWSTVSAGNYFCLAVKTDGTLWSWGINGNGQLGLSTTTNYSSPKQVGALTAWLSVASGYDHSAAIKTDGTLWAWGKGTRGALGLGNTTDYSSPKQVGSLTDWAKISLASSFCLAVKTDGTFWGWGSNIAGQLGLGNRTNYSSPKQIGTLNNWASVSAGGLLASAGQYANAMAVKTDGTLWTWGANTYGNLGLSNSTPYSSPKQVGSLTDWLKINSSYNFQSSIKTNGTIWSWGRNNRGQLGLGNTTSYSSPKQIGLLTNWSSIAVGDAYNNLAISN